jgi:hypothetical protein
MTSVGCAPLQSRTPKPLRGFAATATGVGVIGEERGESRIFEQE